MSRLASPTLKTTVFATLASIQLFCLFQFWTFSGSTLWVSSGWERSVLLLLFGSSWLLVAKTMSDAGLGVQLGYLGWWSEFQGQAPNYGPMPVCGSFRHTRQPVYLAFALTLWTVPVWTLDQLELALLFTAYCVLGPRLKEQRYLDRFGQKFRDYQESVPYFLPSASHCEQGQGKVRA